MPRVTRLLTSVEIDDRSPTDSVRARLHAVLDDGRQILLLDDRGWTSGVPITMWGLPGYGDIGMTARTVVGPDGAYGDMSQAEMDTGHSETLARRLRDQGVEIAPGELSALPHDVELGERLSAQVANNRPASRSPPAV
jgi:hypothetical protein